MALLLYSVKALWLDCLSFLTNKIAPTVGSPYSYTIFKSLKSLADLKSAQRQGVPDSGIGKSQVNKYMYTLGKTPERKPKPSMPLAMMGIGKRLLKIL